MKRNTCARAFTLAAFLLPGALETLNADILYQQPSVWNGNGSHTGAGYTDELDSTLTGYQTFDSFAMTESATVNQVSWIGLYINGSIFLNEPPNTTSWDIDLYANNAGAPGTLLSQTNLTTAQVTSQVLGTGVFGGATFTFYEFTAAIPGVGVGPGTYWFSPLSHNPDQSTKFIWMDGTGGTTATFQDLYTNGNVGASFHSLEDRAFTIDGIAPEPSGYVLMGSGLVLAALLRRRK